MRFKEVPEKASPKSSSGSKSVTERRAIKVKFRGKRNQEEVWTRNLVDNLLAKRMQEKSVKLTWLNHYSAVKTLNSGVNLSYFDGIGIDGTFLRLLLGKAVPRTSADLVLPILMDSIGHCTVGIIGSNEGKLRAAERAIARIWPNVEVAWAFNGYSNRPKPTVINSELSHVDILIVGLGSPAQDEYIGDVPRSNRGSQIILTCGGWIDQIGEASYYPSWAYPLHLNWLIRVVKEPRRLWKRYTKDALIAWRYRRQLRASLCDLPQLFDTATSSLCQPIRDTER